MGISIIILFVLVCLFGMFVYGGILLFKKRWKLGAILIAPPILAAAAISIGFLYFSHTTHPDSLDLSLRNQSDDTYQLSGKWKERTDFYSYGTDFVAICTKDNQKVNMIDYKKGDWKPNYYQWGTDIPYEIKKTTTLPEGCVPQLFDVELQKEFSMTFQVKDPLSLYYVHIRIDPMDSPSFWVKPVNF